MINTQIREGLHDLGISLKTNNLQQKTTCPKCSHNRKNKKDPCLSVNLEKGFFNCHNCGWSGNANLKQKKEFVLPVDKSINLSSRTLSYFSKRGISKKTLKDWDISESDEYFQKIQKKRKSINFKYYKHGKVVNIKYRDAEKNFKMVSNAELTFYGIDNCLKNDEIYIVEGEIDALSLHECGIYNVISVPNGASQGNQKLEYLDNSWEFFTNVNKIILCTDNDKAGLSLRHELARRFGKEKCQYVDFDKYKDANEILSTEGAEVLRTMLKTKKDFPLEGILNIDEIWEDVINLNENGVENYSLGINNSDEFFKIQMGEWSTVCGVPNSGKSDFVDQVCVNMALTKGFKTGFFAPESFPYEGHIKRLANKINEKYCTTEDLNSSKSFIEDHFFFIKIDIENLTLKGILDNFKQLVFRHGINLCVIDPWNMLDHTAQRDYQYIGTMLSYITQFCQQTNTHLFLVAHPRKMEVENNIYKVPTPYDISGSSDFFNKSFNCLTVYRSIGERTEFDSDAVKIYIQKVKRKENGKLGMFTTAPDFRCGGVYRSIDPNKQRFTALNDDVPF